MGEMKHFIEINGRGTVIRVGQHKILHMCPPAPADFRFGNSLPHVFGLDLGIGKKLITLTIEKDTVTTNAMVSQYLLQLGPDRTMPFFVLFLIAWPQSHQERFSDHLQIFDL
jgi:hypothetical protein